MSYNLMLLAVGADSRSDIERGCIRAERVNGFGEAMNERYPFVGQINGAWFDLVKIGSERILGAFDLCDFEFELGANLPWRMIEHHDRYPLFFKSDEILRDFGEIVDAVLELSPKKTMILLPRYQGEERGDVCGVISSAELFALIGECRIYGNVCYIVRKSTDLTESFIRASERGIFSREELSAKKKEIAALLPGCTVDHDEGAGEDWVRFYNDDGRAAMLHSGLKILFTSADIDVDGVEVIRCGSFDANEWSFDIDVILEKKLLRWCAEDHIVNPLCFSLNDLYWASV